MVLGLMLNIFSASRGKRLSTLTAFHSFVPLHSRSETIRSWSTSFAGPNGVPRESSSIHRSVQTRVVLPSPIAFVICVASRSRPSRRLLHPCEQEVVGLTDNKPSFWQYFPTSTLARRQSGLVNTRQACLASRAVLNSWISLMPSPPISFGRVSLLQAIQQIFLLSSALSHQNLVRADCILLHRL
ncbi:hypothetical protein YC2023_033755 [Brassica napus]